MRASGHFRAIRVLLQLTGALVWMLFALVFRDAGARTTLFVCAPLVMTAVGECGEYALRRAFGRRDASTHPGIGVPDYVEAAPPSEDAGDALLFGQLADAALMGGNPV